MPTLPQSRGAAHADDKTPSHAAFRAARLPAHPEQRPLALPKRWYSRKKANAFDRVTSLIEALMHPARAVRHFLKKICKGLISSHLTPTAPPSDAIPRAALTCVQQFVDTS